MSRARAKGTTWETELVPILANLFGPQVDRAPLRGVNDRGDFVGVPWLHEAKSTQVPRFLDWARTAQKKAENWVILWHGDRRKAEGPYVMMSLELYGKLARCWDYHVGPASD